jgi:hypothetical protein
MKFLRKHFWTFRQVHVDFIRDPIYDVQVRFIRGTPAQGAVLDMHGHLRFHC